MNTTNFNKQSSSLKDPHAEINEEHITKSTSQETSRTSSLPSLVMSSNILSGLSNSINSYGNNLREFESYIRSSLNKSEEIKGRCGEVLSTVLSELKISFSEFAQEWKVELPLICNEFMDIVAKICTVYQQEVEKLTEINQKWEFSYHQLLKASNFSENSTSSLESSCKLVSPRAPEVKEKESKKLKVKVKDTEGEQSIISISDYLKRVNDPEISLMREQITELFEEEESLERDPTSSVDCKTMNEEALKREELKELRLRTLNDDFQRRNFLIHMEKAQNKENYSSKTSQSNSRKSSIGGKDQFWQTLKNFIPSTKTPNFTSIKMSAGKENMSISIKDKNTQILEPPSGSKLQDLRRNIYKNKGQSEWSR